MPKQALPAAAEGMPSGTRTVGDATAFLPMTPVLRARIEAMIEHLVSLLDAVDGDPDLEGDDCDFEPDNDYEWSGDEHEPDEGWGGA